MVFNIITEIINIPIPIIVPPLPIVSANKARLMIDRKIKVYIIPFMVRGISYKTEGAVYSFMGTLLLLVI